MHWQRVVYRTEDVVETHSSTYRSTKTLTPADAVPTETSGCTSALASDVAAPLTPQEEKSAHSSCLIFSHTTQVAIKALGISAI